MGSRTLFLVELFSGSGSFGKAAGRVARRLGYRVDKFSLDIQRKYRPKHCMDILKWHYARDLAFFLRHKGPNDLVWLHASPPCNEYSRAKGGMPRDLKTADALARRALRILRHLRPHYFTIENPVGLLQHRSFMKPLERFKKVASYCHFGRPFRKHTNVWTNVDVELPVCIGATRCRVKRETGRHLLMATTRPHEDSQGRRRAQARMPVERLYGIPSGLVRMIVKAALKT